MPRVLVVDPEAARASALTAALAAAGHVSRHLTTFDAALGALEAELFELVVLDARVTDGAGATLLGRLAERWPDLPCLVFAPSDNETKAAEMLRAGGGGGGG